MHIRLEQPEDHDAIRQITGQAFAPKNFSDGTEAVVIDKLRLAGDLTLSLVAVKEDTLAGHVAFSPVTIGKFVHGWFGLGPVSVHPDLQQQGIGSALIRTGLAQLQRNKAHGCALIGDPNYYRRFGFQSDGSVTCQQLPTRHVQWLSFDHTSPQGELIFSAAFSDE